MSESFYQMYGSFLEAYMLSGINIDELAVEVSDEERLALHITSPAEADLRPIFLGELIDRYSELKAHDPKAAELFVTNLHRLIASGKCSNLPLEAFIVWNNAHGITECFRDFLSIGTDLSWSRGMNGVFDEYREQNRIYLAGRLRRENDLPAARREFDRALEFFESQTTRNHRIFGLLGYEFGHLANMQGDSDLAIRLLEEGAVSAEQSGDTVGALINRTRARFIAAMHGRMTLGVVYTFLIAAKERFEGLSCSGDPKGTLAANWVMNTLSYLVDVSFEMGDVSATHQWRNKFRDDEWVHENGNVEWVQVHSARHSARAAVLDADWEEAIGMFATFCRVAPQFDHFFIDALDAYCRRTIEDAARDYRDLGLALWRMGDIHLAKETWRQGLELPPDLANRPWQQQIQALLDWYKEDDLTV